MGRSCVWTGGPSGRGRPISSPIVTTTPDTGSNAGSIVVLVSGSGTNLQALTGEAFLGEFGGRTVNTHPALLPSFPGMRAPEEALDYGVKVTGATLFVVDSGVDTGPVVAQSSVGVDDDDTVQTLHERIKIAERQMLVDYVGRMVREGFTVTERKVTIP